MGMRDPLMGAEGKFRTGRAYWADEEDPMQDVLNSHPDIDTGHELRDRWDNSPVTFKVGIVATLAAIVAGVCLWASHLFFNGSLSQVHSVCSTFGPLVALGGAHAVHTCSNVDGWYTVAVAGFVISLLVALGSFGVAALRKRV